MDRSPLRFRVAFHGSSLGEYLKTHRPGPPLGRLALGNVLSDNHAQNMGVRYKTAPSLTLIAFIVPA